MANWAFEIDLADNYITDLTGILTDGGFRIWCLQHDDQPVYMFSSAYLNDVPGDHVFVQARQLVRYIDGVSYLLFENKNKVNKIALTTVMDSQVDFTVYNGGFEEDGHPMVDLLKLVPADKFIRELLSVSSQGMDVKGLYQICELIKTFLEEKGGTFGGLVFDAMPLDRAQELVTEVVFQILLTYYDINLKPYIIKERNDFYDTLYD